MDIYVAASASTKNSNYKKDVNVILDVLSSEGHKLTNPYFAIRNDSDTKLTPDENIYKSLKERIESSDCVIAEISESSISLGIQIQHALQNDIPVLCLFKDTSELDLPLLIRDYESPLFFKHTYTDGSLKKVITQFLRDFPKSRIKFNLFITHKINSYLQNKASKTNKAKSEIIREIIEKAIEEDKEL